MLATTIKVGKIALITVAALRGAYDVYQVGAWGFGKTFGKKAPPAVVPVGQPVGPTMQVQEVAQA